LLYKCFIEGEKTDMIKETRPLVSISNLLCEKVQISESKKISIVEWVISRESEHAIEDVVHLDHQLKLDSDYTYANGSEYE
jgi:hypothetical protein